ncbi:MAG: DNA polymerase III subunit delta [Magnetococcales bacterium]|nr:DNA polymerase III subunit delta [Magnetococcales bacterium]
MKLTARDFSARLKREGPPTMALLYGPESGLVARHAALLRRSVVSAEDEEMDAENLHGADLDVTRLLAACNAFPFFARRRSVELREGDQLNAAARKAVLGYLASPSQSSLLTVLAGPLEVRHPLRKAFEEHKSAWCVPHFPLEGRELHAWLKERLREAGFAVEADAIPALAERLEGDARNAESELEKLMLFLGDRRRVTLEDVLASVGESGTRSGFALAEAVLGGRVEQALPILDHLLEAGEEPLALLGLLTQRLRRLAQGMHALRQGEDPESIATRLQVFWKEKNDFFARMRSTSPRWLANALLRCQEADRELKSSGSEQRIMERLVIGLAHKTSGRPASSGAMPPGAGPPPTGRWRS